MKKILLFLSLFAAFAVGGTTLASSASAASCTPDTGTIWYSGGYWIFPEYLSNCSGVNGVEFGGANTPGSDGIYDVTHAAYHWDVTLGIQILGVQSQYISNGPHVVVWGSGCGAPAFQVKPFIYYRIRNSNGSTWGSWHSWMNPASRAIC